MHILTGIPAAKGIAIGPGLIYKPVTATPKRYIIPDPQIEFDRFRSACAEVIQSLLKVYEEALESFGKETADIFQAQVMMLQDPDLITSIEQAILIDHINADFAMYECAEVQANLLESLENEYFQARATDVRDVARRVQNILQGRGEDETSLQQPMIILTEDLAPSDTMHFKRPWILGFFTGGGGTTSHTAILSKAMGVPAIVGAGQIPHSLSPESMLIIDGDTGKLIIDPDEATLALYRERQAQQMHHSQQQMISAHHPAITKDGHRVEVVANIGNLTDAVDAIARGAEGVGLLRTEFSYIEHNMVPDEESLVQSYAAIFSRFGDSTVVVRTLDIGGDKEMPHLKLPVETNPFLGLRGIRLCFNRPDLFKPQLRAILRAGIHSQLCIMFPMVAVINEVRQAKALLKECKQELQCENIPFHQNPQVGIMIEVPSAAICADLLAKEVDFFSIGTNDLTQYTLAADRTNPSVSHLVSALDPAVLRLVKNVIDAAHTANIWVGMCGEMAGDENAIPILLGMGLDEFSMTSPLIPAAKELIRKCDMSQARLLAEQALSCESPQQVIELIQEWSA